jgi:hypothetical protein
MSESGSEKPLTVANIRIVTSHGQHVPRPPQPAKPRRLAKPDLYLPATRWTWLNAAAALPGKALHVFLAIRFEVKTQKKRAVDLTNARLQEMGVDHHAKRRSLQELERAGLITVEYRLHHSPLVTLLDRPGADLPAADAGEDRR